MGQREKNVYAFIVPKVKSKLTWMKSNSLVLDGSITLAQISIMSLSNYVM